MTAFRSRHGNRPVRPLASLQPGSKLSKPAFSSKCAQNRCNECTKMSCTHECHQPLVIKKSPKPDFFLDAPFKSRAFSHS